MSKKISQDLFICLLLTITISLVIFSNEVIQAASFSLSIWIENLFPTLFPFFVVSNLLLRYGFVETLASSVGKIMPSFFHQPKESSFVLCLSLISGFPSGAKYTKELVESKQLTPEEGSRLLTFTHYSNPLFVLGLIGNLLLGNKNLGVIILISHVLAGLFIGILFAKKASVISKRTQKVAQSTTKQPLGTVLSNSIQDALSTLFLLLGIVTIFLVLSTIIEQFFPLNPYLKAVIFGILEMTQGVKAMSTLPITELAKIIWMTIFISFGGLSVHMQVLSIISGTKIKYKYFFESRLFHALLSAILVSCLYILLI